MSEVTSSWIGPDPGFGRVPPGLLHPPVPEPVATENVKLLGGMTIAAGGVFVIQHSPTSPTKDVVRGTVTVPSGLISRHIQCDKVVFDYVG